MGFINYLIRWISNNLAVPFWMVGHIHLSLNVYQDIYEIIASLGMNIIVAIGFWLDFKQHKKEKNEKTNICR
jgi:hypothetical protein